MIHLLETQLLNNKLVHIELTKIYGINKKTSLLICKKIGLSKNIKIFELSTEQKSRIISIVESLNIKINSDLLRIKRKEKQKLVSIKTYRGLRRLQGFPVRGQRTRSNSKTSRKIK